MISSFLVSRSGLTIETCRIMLSIYANWREQRIQVPLTFNALLLQRIATDKPCLPPYPTLTTRHVSRGHHHLTTPLDILVLQSRQATRTIDHYSQYLYSHQDHTFTKQLGLPLLSSLLPPFVPSFPSSSLTPPHHPENSSTPPPSKPHSSPPPSTQP
jgi:hypothetical protein